MSNFTQPADTPKSSLTATLCAGCGAIFVNKRWSRSPGVRVRTVVNAGGSVTIRICPACRRGRSAIPHGFLHVDGRFVAPHRDEIVSLLNTETQRCAEHHAGRVLDWGEDGTGGLLVTTTTDSLAIRLGRALEKAFTGRLLFGVSSESRLAHVWWHGEV